MLDAKKIIGFLHFGSLALAAAALPATTAHADVKAGVDAWSAGDFAAAVKEWTPLADKGDPDAQFNLAQAYKMGRGVAVDIARATELYGKAAAGGHLQAADTYGLLLFQNGEREKAMPLIEASAGRGDPRAQYILGIAHFNGDLAPKDWVRAYALVSLARQAGLAQAENALAQMDRHIPLVDRQNAVVLSAQLAADGEAARQRQQAAAELAPQPPAVAASGRPAAAPAAVPAKATEQAAGPSHAGADFLPPAPAVAAVSARPAAPPAPRPSARPVVPPASVGWRIQLGAFGVPANADTLWNRAKGRPELVGHDRLLVPAGKLVKLQATGFASRAAADGACARLVAGGFTCIAVED